MIIGFVGMMGSSKTLSLTRRVYQLYKEGYKVLSNMHFNFPHERITMKDLLEYTTNSEKFENCVVVLDEVHIFIDSRRSISEKNVIISTMLTQTRKRSVRLFWTSQQEHQCDKRLRDNTDILIRCSKIMLGELVVAINDLYFMDGRMMREWFVGNQYFHLYDTNQVISL